MKRIFILAASFYMVACSQSEQTVITDATIAADTATLVDTAQVDGVSGATNVANVSSFNGVIDGTSPTTCHCFAYNGWYCEKYFSDAWSLCTEGRSAGNLR